MHSVYPLVDEDMNLRRIKALEELFNCPVGYSGHESGIVPCRSSLPWHYFLRTSHNSRSRHVRFRPVTSLEPQAFISLVSSAKKIVACMGDGRIDPHPDEYSVAKKLRAHILVSD